MIKDDDALGWAVIVKGHGMPNRRHGAAPRATQRGATIIKCEAADPNGMIFGPLLFEPLQFYTTTVTTHILTTTATTTTTTTTSTPTTFTTTTPTTTQQERKHKYTT